MPPIATVSYWPEKKANARFVPVPSDPGTIDFLRINAQESLYHSPFSGVYRATELFLEEWDWTQPGAVKMSPELANSMFGIPDELVFEEPIHLGAAQLMHDRKIAELDREFVIGTGSTGAGRVVAGFVTQLGATALDPINLASMFVPIVGETRFARMIQTAGGSMFRARLRKGAIEGAVGALMVEPFVLLPAIQEQSNYGIGDSIINLGFGATLGAIFQTGFGFILDLPKNARDRQIKELFLQSQEALNGARERVQRATPEEQDTMFRSAISDIVQDEPMSSPGDLVEVTRGELTERTQFDLEKAREEAIRELGFDTDQPDLFTHKNPNADNAFPADTDFRQVPDPRPNEPWFHGRSQDIGFEAGRVAYFSRDPEFADVFSKYRQEREGGERAVMFVANLDIKNPARQVDLVEALNQYFGELQQRAEALGIETGPPDEPPRFEAGQILLGRELEEHLPRLAENMAFPPSLDARVYTEAPMFDLLEIPRVREILIGMGFDGYVGGLEVTMGNVDGQVDVALVWDTEQIKTPGRRPVKTDVGIKWADGRDLELELDQRIENLRKAKIGNLVEKKRRQFKREQESIKQVQDHVRPVNAPEPMEFRDPDLDRQTAEVEREVAEIEDDMRPTRTEAVIEAEVDARLQEQLLSEPIIKPPDTLIEEDPNFKFRNKDLRNEELSDGIITEMMVKSNKLTEEGELLPELEELEFGPSQEIPFATGPLNLALDDLMRRGLDPNDIEEITFGFSKFVLILKDDWVIKFSLDEPTVAKIPELFPQRVYKNTYKTDLDIDPVLFAEVVEKVTPSIKSDLSVLQTRQVFSVLLKDLRERRLWFWDDSPENWGIREDNSPVILDEGATSKPFNPEKVDQQIERADAVFDNLVQEEREALMKKISPEELDLTPEERALVDEQMAEIPDLELNERAVRAAIDCLKGGV